MFKVSFCFSLALYACYILNDDDDDDDDVNDNDNIDNIA